MKMTISSTTNRVSYVGNGVTTAFAFPYKFLVNADLKVYQDDTLKTITTHYTVSGAGGDSGGTVTFVTAPPTSEVVVIIRDPAITQTTDFVENDALQAETLENTLDKLTIIAQRLDDKIGRSITLPESDVSGASTELPAPVAEKFLRWNAAADALELVSVGEFTPTSVTVPVPVSDGGTGSATAADARTALGVQPLNATLTAIAAQTEAANKVQYYTADNTPGLLDFKDEDNMASDSATAVPSQQSVKAYADATKKILQVVEATPYTTYTSITTVIPIDATIPQNTVGNEIVTVAITPTSATNRLRIEAICEMVNAGANLDCAMALFQDATANALAGAIKQLGGSGVYSQIVLSYEMAAGTTSATTFKIRIGPGSGTIYVNGNASNRIFGGVSAVRLRVTEIKV